jgi:hypothetical protein
MIPFFKVAQKLRSGLALLVGPPRSREMARMGLVALLLVAMAMTVMAVCPARVQKPAPAFTADAVVGSDFKSISLSDFVGILHLHIILPPLQCVL